VRRSGCLLEMALVEFEHGVWRSLCGHRRGFQHLVIEGNRQFVFVQVGAKEHVETIAANNGLSRGSPLNWIKQWLGCEANFHEQKTAAQGKILKWRKVEHGSIVGETLDNSRL